jgi:hypothetical protein
MGFPLSVEGGESLVKDYVSRTSFKGFPKLTGTHELAPLARRPRLNND